MKGFYRKEVGARKLISKRKKDLLHLLLAGKGKAGFVCLFVCLSGTHLTQNATLVSGIRHSFSTSLCDLLCTSQV